VSSPGRAGFDVDMNNFGMLQNNQESITSSAGVRGFKNITATGGVGEIPKMVASIEKT
jgi:hypothetical protein